MTAQHAGTAHYTPLGTIESRASTAAMLAILQMLRPQWHIRLVPMESANEPRYRVEVDCDDGPPQSTPIDPWLHIKSALMASFPADKPNPVTAIDP